MRPGHPTKRIPLRVRQSQSRARRWAHRQLRLLALRPGRGGETDARREQLSILYLRGEGIEIGALHRPLWIPNASRVTYVDRLSRDDLLRVWSDTYGRPTAVVETAVLDDADRLECFADASLDFVVANHLLEHLEDPVGALIAWSRVLRPAGVLFITVPDARATFDNPRPRTPVEHVLRDHADGPGVSRADHYREWVETIERVPSDQVPARVAELIRTKRGAHFHVWELDGFLDLLMRLDLPVRLEAAQTAGAEFTVVLRKLERSQQ
jgi:SAM-dependent methyltransferase